MDLKTLILLLPVIFMLHDFEEIIFFKSWLKRNRNELLRRFPAMAPKLLSHLESLSTPAFTFIVAEEFLLVSIVSLHAATTGYYQLWYGVFMGFSIHLIIHLIQWMIYRKYIPTMVTSVLMLPYCIYTFLKVNEWGIFKTGDKILWSVLGLIIIFINLLLMHKLISKQRK